MKGIKMNLQAVGNRVIAKLVDIEHTSAGGIVLSAGCKTTVGQVVSVGEDVTKVAVGDKCMYLENVLFDFLGDKYVTFTDDKIIGKVAQ